MTTEAFNKGFTTLNKIFPALKLDAKLFWELLNDLDGQFFLVAIFELIKTTKEIYPNTNIIAIIRARAEELKVEIFKNSTFKLTAETEKDRVKRWQEEAVPMPEDCRRALEDLGLTKQL